MHSIWRDARTAVAQRRTRVDDEIAALAVLADQAMTSEHKMHPAIKAAALEFGRDSRLPALTKGTPELRSATVV